MTRRIAPWTYSLLVSFGAALLSPLMLQGQDLPRQRLRDFEVGDLRIYDDWEKAQKLAAQERKLLGEGVSRIENVPHLRDVLTMTKLLRVLGARVNFTYSTVEIRPGNKAKVVAPYSLVSNMRASVCVLVPLLARHGEAEDFRNYLLTRSGKKCGLRKAKPLSEATTRRRCGCAKGFFAYAVAKGIIARNPFDSRKVPTTAPNSRQKEFVTPEVAECVMAQFPTTEWRLLFALARWGEMRVPSEPESLRWADIDFERMRINFRCPKTEHHEGKDRREIPVFPELVEPLREVFEAAKAGEEFVLPFLRRITGTALRKPMLAAMRAAQVKPWPKLWNALRASRVTELRESFPSHVVDAWIGHDDKIARMHYAQTLDHHFDRALQKCSHFASSTDAHETAPETENAKTPAQRGTALHGEAASGR